MMSITPDHCLFCKIINKTIISNILYEDQWVVVFEDKFPKAKIHWLIAPKIHLENLNQLQPEHEFLIFHITQLLPKLAKQANLSGFRTIINTGKSGGQEINHLHYHLLGGDLKLIGF